MSPVSRLQCHNSKACQFQGFSHWGEILTTRQSAPVQYTEVSARENKSELCFEATFSCNALCEKKIKLIWIWDAKGLEECCPLLTRGQPFNFVQGEF